MLHDRLAAALKDRYTIERELGRGGMATVYLARDIRHGRSVALKVLHPSISSAVGAERFLREIRTVAALQHPNIVPLFDSGEAAGCIYYVMPHVQGGSLRDRLRHEKQLSIENALTIAAAVADALGHAHAHGVVHRDVKPENILLSGGRAVIADFGLARSLAQPGGFSLTEVGAAVGTVAYMSPEQASGRERVDARTDQYALGCVLYEMLAGQPPFTGATQSAVLARHATEQPPSLRIVRPAVPRNVDAAIRKALAKVPADRHQNMEAFARALGRAPNRRPWLAAAGAAAGVAAIAIAALSPWRSNDARGAPAADLSRIAVLYFDDASQGDSLTWLAHGLTEDLIDALSMVDGLAVTTRNGVRAFIADPASPDSIGRVLSVGLIVDGSVRPVAGDSIAVTVRLIDAKRAVQVEHLSVTHLAAEPLQLRREVTSELELALRRRIGRHVRLRQERDAARSDVAWEIVQRAREIRDDGLSLGSRGDSEAALRALARADSMLGAAERAAPEWNEPILQRANLAIASAYERVGMKAPVPAASDRRPAVAALRRGLDHVERVLERDPSNLRANAIEGELLYRLWEISPERSESVLNESLHALQAAAQGDRPPPRAWYVLSDVLRALGRLAEAEVAAERALQEDIFAEEAASMTADLFFEALRENRTAADTICATGRRRYSADPNFLECELTLLGWFGAGEADMANARTLARQLDSIPALAGGTIPRRLMVAAVLARSGRGDEARAEIRAAHQLAGGEGNIDSFAEPEAYVALLLGDTARALQLLETVVAGDPSARPWLAAHPWFQGIANEPRFRRLVSR